MHRRTALAATVLAACAALAAPLPAATLTVGRVAATAGVDAGGGATWSVPVRVAAGINGLAPDLALAWRSQAGDGPAGHGTELAGLSRVTRCPRLIATDQRVRGVQFDDGDRYCLDGQVLVAVAGAYGADGSEYRTEVDRLERVWSRGRAGAGPAAFEVRQPDGSTRFYGTDTDSRVLTPGLAGTAHEWALNATRDLFGNQVVYRYREDAGRSTALPAEIRWTADGNGQGGRFRLVFDWDARDPRAVRRGFAWGSPWTRDLRLTAIRYEADEGQGFVPVHRYALGYEHGATGRQRLARIEHCGPTTCVPATTLAWEDGAAGFAALAAGPGDEPGSVTYTDIDGDGASDLLLPVGPAGSARWYLRRTNPATGLPAATATDTGIPHAGATFPLDFDGDGRRDLLTVSPTTPATWRVHRSTGTGYGPAIDTGVPAVPVTGTATPLDVDGDGRDDLVYLREQRLYVRLSTGTGFGPEQATTVDTTATGLLLPLVSGLLPPADFDGDGRADLLVRRQGLSLGAPPAYYEGYRSTGTDFVRAFTTDPAYDALTLDVNGDGLTDLLLRDVASNRWLLRTSLGPTLAAPVASGIPGNPPTLRVADWNGDGRDDLVRETGTTGWRVHFADDGAATPYSDTDPARYTTLAGSPTPAEAALALVDLTGDGFADLLHYRGATRRWEVRRRTSPRPDLLAGITDGLGNTWSASYAPLAGLAGYTLDGSDGPGDRLLRGGPLTVVTAVTESDGAGGSYTVSYRYWNGRVSRTGRGFLGFGMVRSTDSRQAALHGVATHTDTAYRQDFPLVGAVDLTETKRADGSRVHGRDLTWTPLARPTAADPAGRSHFVALTREVTTEYETDDSGSGAGALVRRSDRTLTWDLNHGIATRDVVVTTSPDDPLTHTTTTQRTPDEAARAGAGCLGLVTREDVTEATSAGDSATRTASTTWSGTTCRRLTATTGSATVPARQLVTSYGYNAAGQATVVTRRAGDGGLPERRTQVAYASGSDRPLSETAVNGTAAAHVTRHSWHFGLDVELTRTDPRGITGSWRWDEFGRLARVTQPDAPGGGSTLLYLACGSECFAPHASYRILTFRDDGFRGITEHDALGREVGRELPLAGGTVSRQVITRDAYGRVTRESVPQAGTAPPAHWVAYAYEPGGRTREEQRPATGDPAGARTRHRYAGLATTTTDAEDHAVTRVSDARGRPAQVTAADGGIARYTHTPFGEVASITDAVGTVTRLTYDDRGLPASVQSPDSGLRATTYNAFGELATETDATGATIRHAYDALGRLATRTDPAGTATWEYGTVAGPAFGQPVRVSTPAGGGNAAYSEAYAYDGAGRRSRVTTTIDGTGYVTDLAYDELGRLGTLTYPATVGGARPRFRYRYDNAGFLAVVEQDASGAGGPWLALYQLQAHDALGRPRHVRLGTGTPIERRHLIDPGTLRLTGIRTGTGSGAERQHLDYRWDRVGNLVERADRNAGLVEDFSFDAADRLTGARLNGTPTLTVGWDAGGRLRTRSDVGTYQYAPARPSAVAAVGGGPRGTLSYTYNANGNLVSRNGQPITWTAFNQPLRISHGSSDYAEFGYGPARQRVRQVARTGGTTRTTHYVGPHFEVELEGSVRRYRSAVFANGEAFYLQVEQSAPAALDAYFLHRDHQGSIDTLTRAVGTGPDTRRQAFDAFGKRRNTDWTADPTDQRYGDAHFTERGFTAHEHLDNVRLIHMNGRLQDPLLGLMVSPDPLLGDLAEPGTLNRYAYVAGNGVSAADPSGFFLRRLVKNIGRAIRSIGSFVRRVIRRYGRELLAAVAAYYTGGLVNDAYLGAFGVSAKTVAEAGLLGGFAGGAVSGAIARGDPTAIITSGLSAGILNVVDLKFGAEWSVKRLATQASVAGALAYVEGGAFTRGFGAGAVTGGARFAYQRVVGYAPTWAPGGDAQPKGRFQLPVAGANNFGVARAVVDPDDFFGEGGRLSRLLNRVPGMNAIAGLHDVMQVDWDRWGGRSLRSTMNYPGMGPAALLTYPALLDGASATRLAGDDD